MAKHPLLKEIQDNISLYEYSNELGEKIDLSVVTEKALTIYLNSQEILIQL